MTDFDQLIKEKVEQKEYPYSAASWHSFARKAGLKSALTITQSVIIAVVSVSIVAVGSWFGIRHFSAPDEVVPEVVVEETPAEEPIMVAADTTIIEEVAEEPVAEEMVPTPSRKPAPKVTNEMPNVPATDTVAEQKPAREPILRPKKPRRILEIDPDTIKSNE